VRNPNYWNKPLPYLDQLTVKINADNQQGVDTLVAGQAQINQQLYRLYSDQAVKAGLNRTIYTVSGGSTVIFNTTKAPFDDVRARQAVSMAVNPVQLAAAVYNGADQPPQTLFAKTSPFYDKSLQLPVSNATGPNPDAQKLFDQLAAAKGGPLKFSLNANPTTQHQNTAKAIQTQMSGYKNVEMTINTLDNAAFQVKLVGLDFQATFSGTSSPDPEPQMYNSFKTGGANNYGKFTDPQMDQALEQGRNGKTLADRKAAYKTFQQLFIKDVPGLIYTAQSPSWSYAKNMSGFDMWANGILVSWAKVGFTTSKK
jgi:peptide/nickel transport system substrate-binding protein